MWSNFSNLELDMWEPSRKKYEYIWFSEMHKRPTKQFSYKSVLQCTEIINSKATNIYDVFVLFVFLQINSIHQIFEEFPSLGRDFYSAVYQNAVQLLNCSYILSWIMNARLKSWFRTRSWCNSLSFFNTHYIKNNNESVIYVLLYTLLSCVVPVGSEKRDASALGNTF